MTLHKRWNASSPSGEMLFSVCKNHAMQNEPDLKVERKDAIDFKVRGSKSTKAFYVYKGDAATELALVASDEFDMNKFVVEIDTKEDGEMLEKIVFSITAVVDAMETAGRMKVVAGKIAAGAAFLPLVVCKHVIVRSNVAT
ncbi:hypothetical protein L1987_21250 [Smallanthus sonchifolius]|uniref:Uncharacterized protein n=1 Tax=Smallanthus sonchifolius TaxID=185202 RepID=A0ACB9IVL4_9ASTR|nr:hypothetical protein L1987_21250 [Smallanthus sonchifolius]